MTDASAKSSRCGMDTVELVRMEKLLQDRSPEELSDLFTPGELKNAGTGAGRIASLAARFAAKEACLKLFPRETALGLIQPCDFGIERDAYGAPQVCVSPAALEVLDRYRVGQLRVTLTHSDTVATAMVWADLRTTPVPWYGKLLYYFFPYRRSVILGNLRRVFGKFVPEDEISRLAQSYYAHYVRFLFELLRRPFMSEKRRKAWIKVENMESPIRAHAQGKGIFLLTGHIGNWEVATVAGIGGFPEYRGLLYFIRRTLKPAWLNSFATWRFRKAGFRTLPKRGSIDAIFDALSRGGIVVYVFDQHAGPPDGIPVDFFGHPAGTFKSLAIMAMDTGAPVIPVSSWREPDGTHVIRFEEPLPLIECENITEAIHRNTRLYNSVLERMILRHPEQWIWNHRRWKPITRNGPK